MRMGWVAAGPTIGRLPRKPTPRRAAEELELELEFVETSGRERLERDINTSFIKKLKLILSIVHIFIKKKSINHQYQNIIYYYNAIK